MKKVESASHKAMAIAMEESWPHLQVAVLSTVGLAWMRRQEYDKALKEFDTAEAIARESLRKKEAAAARLLANTLFSKAAIFVNQKAFEKGAKIYEDIAPILQEEKNDYLTMEAWRMAGYCYQQNSEYSKALECTHTAFEIGDVLEEEKKKHSTLPYVGEALIKLLRRRNEHVQADAVEAKMKLLFGADWKPSAALKTI